MKALDELLADSLRACGDGFVPNEIPEARAQFVRGLGRRRILRAAGAVAFAGAAAAIALLIGRWAAVERGNIPSATQPVVAQTYPVGDQPVGVLAAGEAVWVANRGDGTLTRVEVPSGRTRTVKLFEAAPVALATSSGFLFVAEDAADMLLPVDPRSGSVPTSHPLGPAPGDVVATGDGGVWASSLLEQSSGAGTVWLQARTSEREGSDAPELPSVAAFRGRPELAARANVVWAASADGVSTLRLDRGAVVQGENIEVRDAADIAAGPGGDVWVVTDSGSLVRIDAATEQVTAEADVGLPPGARIAAGGSGIWLLGSREGRGDLLRVDPESLRVVGRLALSGGPFGIATAGDAVWVTDESRDLLYRVEGE